MIKITNRHIYWSKWIMIFVVFFLMIFLVIGAFFESIEPSNKTQFLVYCECMISLITLIALPLATIPVAIYLASLGYKKGFIDHYYEKSSSGPIADNEAVKMGWTQIIGSFFTLSLGVIVSILLWRNYQTAFHCPSEFYELTWWEVLQKLY